MAIIHKKIGNTIYVCEATYYNEDGKQKYKWKTIGKLDENGILIPSRKRCAEQAEQVKQSEQSVQIEGQPEVQAVQTAQSQQVSQASSPVSSSQASQESQPAPTTHELHETLKALQETQRIETVKANLPTEQQPPTQQEVTTNALAVIDTAPGTTEPEAQETQEAQSDSTAEIQSEKIINVSTTRVDKSLCGTTKAEGIVFNPQKNEALYREEGGAINVSKNEINRKNIDVMISLDIKELSQNNIAIPYADRLTPFDRAVHNAIATLWEAGHRNQQNNNEQLTPRIIFQILSGNTGSSEGISPETRKAILRSIDKMSSTSLRIDNTSEAKTFGYKNLTYKGNLLEAERLEGIKINGNEVDDCIHIFRSPIMPN